MLTFITLVALLTSSLQAVPASQAVPAVRAADCREWRECRQLALDAHARGEYETFHDLAWRAVQTGSAHDPTLMYLLARAQSLSRRSHDALVMLGRLAEMGVATDAATNDEFRAVRRLPEWPELEALMATIAARTRAAAAEAPTSVSPVPPASPPASKPAVSAPSAKRAAVAPAPAPAVSVPAPAASNPPAARPGAAIVAPRSRAEDALRLPDTALDPTGLAYDGVSGRFIVSDRREQKLVVLDERSHQAVDFVRSVSVGFSEVTAFEIDPRRGTLWVASAGRTGSDVERSPVAALHKLQLVSGRSLEQWPVPDQLEPARFEDVAVSAAGVVFALDSAGGRIFRLAGDSRGLTVVATLPVQGATSIAPVDDHSVYVSDASGIARVDTSTGVVRPLNPPKATPLSGFERIRWNRSSLLGIQQMPDGSRRLVSIRFAGGRILAADVVEPDILMAGPTAVTLSGDDFYFVTRSSQGAGAGTEIIVRRIRLR